MAAASWDAVETSADVQGRIAQLWVYPVKSCAGVQVPAVRLDATGLAQDREWMVVDPQGVFLTQRSHPRMALIQPELLDGGEVLALQAPARCAMWCSRRPMPPCSRWRCGTTAWPATTRAMPWQGG
jgi:uncharacterized protein YcbX